MHIIFKKICPRPTAHTLQKQCVQANHVPLHGIKFGKIIYFRQLPKPSAVKEGFYIISKGIKCPKMQKKKI